MSKILNKTLFACVLVFMQVMLSSAYADPKSNNIADAWIMVPNAGQEGEFEKAFNAHLKFRAAKGDPRSWHTYVAVTGSNLNHYIVRYCCTKWGDIDAYNEWSDNNEVQQHWNANVAQYVESYQHHFDELDLENGKWPEKDPGFKYFGITDYKVKAGHGQSTAEGIKALSSNAKDMKWPYSWAWIWAVSGESNLSLVIPYKNYADMTDPEITFDKALATHLGSEEKAGEILKAWSNNFKKTSYTIYRLREDMSM